MIAGPAFTDVREVRLGYELERFHAEMGAVPCRGRETICQARATAPRSSFIARGSVDAAAPPYPAISPAGAKSLRVS